MVYYPMAYVPHGRGRTATNVVKKIRSRVDKKWVLFTLSNGGGAFCGTRSGCYFIDTSEPSVGFVDSGHFW